MCETDARACSSLLVDGSTAARASGAVLRALAPTSTTVSLWFKPTNPSWPQEGTLFQRASATCGGVNATQLLYQPSTGAWVARFAVQLCCGSGLPGCVDNISFVDIRVTRVLPVGIWAHVAATYDAATGNAALVVNGEVLGTNRGGSGLRYVDPTIGLSIGGPAAPSDSYNANGLIDDVTYFDRALSVAELDALRVNGVIASGLLARWRLAQSTGTTVAGEGPNGTSLSLTRASWSSECALVNLALGRPTRQSSTHTDGGCDRSSARAVDGVTCFGAGTPLFDAGRCASIGCGNIQHTSSVSGSFWEVDLQSVRAISRVEIFPHYRTALRLRFSVDGVTWTDRPFPTFTPDPTFTGLDVSVSARYVRVEASGTEHVATQEVMVLGPPS